MRAMGMVDRLDRLPGGRMAGGLLAHTPLDAQKGLPDAIPGEYLILKQGYGGRRRKSATFSGITVKLIQSAETGIIQSVMDIVG